MNEDIDKETRQADNRQTEIQREKKKERKKNRGRKTTAGSCPRRETSKETLLWKLRGTRAIPDWDVLRFTFYHSVDSLSIVRISLELYMIIRILVLSCLCLQCSGHSASISTVCTPTLYYIHSLRQL